jgi:hypothetical protein
MIGVLAAGQDLNSAWGCGALNDSRRMHDMKPKFRNHIDWWDSLTKEDRAKRFRHLSENPYNYKDLTTWSQNAVKHFFEDERETLEAEASFRAAHPDAGPMDWQPIIDDPKSEVE